MARRKSNASMKVMGLLFLIIGLIFVGVAGKFFYDNLTYDDRYDAVTAVISEIYTTRDSDGDTDHSVYVSYTYDGDAYTNVRLGSYSSDMHEGGRYTVYIDPKRPGDPKVKSPAFVCFMIFLFGGILAVVGFVIFKSGGNKGNPKLKETGTVTQANVTHCGYANIRVNGSSMYNIKAEFVDMNGVTHKVKTQLLNYDPSPYVFARNNVIPVYVDPANPKKYYIDTDAIYDEVHSGMMGMMNQNMMMGQNMGMMNPNMMNQNMMNQNMMNQNMMNQGMNYNQQGYNQQFNQQGYNQQNYNQNYNQQNFGNNNYNNYNNDNNDNNYNYNNDNNDNNGY